MPTKFERLLNLAAVLDSANRPLTAQDIRSRLGTYSDNDVAFRRTFERDKEDLMAMGIPLQVVDNAGDDGRTPGYVLDRSVTDPGFTPAELAALQVAAARLALRDDDAREVADLREGLRKLGGLRQGGAPATSAEIHIDHIVSRIFAAITEGRAVDFVHRGTQRHLVPRRLVLRRGNWYVNGFDLDRGEPRTFRVDRIEGEVDLGEQVEGDLDRQAASLRLRPWEFGSAEPVAATIMIDAELVPLALTQDPELEVVQQRSDGSVVVELAVRNRAGLWGWLGSFLDRAELLAPAQLRSEWIERLSASLADPAQEPA